MTLLKSSPVLASLNTNETVAFYHDKLNFKIGWHDENYVIIGRDKIEIHFWKCDDEVFPQNTSCYVYVDQVDKLYEEFEKAGVVHPNGKIEDKPYGIREFAILDIHGNMIKFGEELDES